MDAESYIDHLERLLAEARPVPLSSSVMVNRYEAEEALAGLAEQLPEEVRQARWVLKERDEILAKARREAEQALADARIERDRLVSESEVERAARREADRILEDAREQARRLRLEAEDYIDAKLGDFEIALHKVLSAVDQGRQRLRGRPVTDPAPAPDGEEDREEPPVSAPPEQTPRGQGPRLYDHESPES